MSKNYSSILILYNPSAMKSKIDEFLPYIKKRLSARYSIVDFLTGGSSEGMQQTAFDNSGKYDIIVSCGGDGTLHQVINGIIKSGNTPILGIMPFGTCNDVSKTLHIPNDLDKSIDALLKLETINYDIMHDNQNFITYSMAAGYLTKCSYSTSQKMKKKFGRFGYFLTALKTMFKFNSIPLTITCDGERFHGKFMYFMLMNGERVGGFKVGETNTFADGKIKVVLIKRKSWLRSVCVFLRMMFFGIASIRKSKLAIIKDAKVVEIENHSNVGFTLDGEKEKFLKKRIEVGNKLEMVYVKKIK